MTHSNDSNFRAGFILAMKDIQNRNMTIIISDCDSDYSLGYMAGIDHFNGNGSMSFARADDLGLIAEYEGFHGQSDFCHPEV